MTAVIDYGAGNLTSVLLALKFLGDDPVITDDPAVLEQADRIIFPGVGSAASGMEGLKRKRLDEALKKCCMQNKPILAICLGMQMLLEFSEEDDGVNGLGLFPGKVKLFKFPPEQRIKVPHMGWNTVRQNEHVLWKNIPDNSAFYFVHSYYVSADNASDVAGVTEYGGFEFVSAVARKNLFATQFHPERSGEMGLLLLKNFLEWDDSSCC